MLKKPNFFILGAPKCGTTALAHYLSEHPNIYMCDPKEPNFFTRDFPVYQKQFKNISEYEQLFSYANKQQHIIGEASVWYLYSKTAVKEILENYPNAKLIVMVRNPVDMATSLHSQMVLMREETVTDFSEAWNLQNLRARGKDIPINCREPDFLQYKKVCSLGEQISRLLETTKGLNTKIIFFDDMIKDTRATYLDIMDFLEIEDDNRTEFPVINANRNFRSPLLHYIIIRSPILIRPFLKVIKKIFRIKRFKLLEKAFNMNTVTTKRNSISSKQRNILLNDFQEDINILSKVSNRDLSNWLTK